ncbi:PilZ domain-containing protein [Clostridium sp. 19966]|uniref:PilZ domain-containing protein n=1 Tax=Clostridium sp. 19966 TaxID=2768166 RepID=UPI0028DFA816|nr:PilZ domain-containing protein [Clostridium sp. 19966]MDT8717187.1 PilZ domain-containing protein [Clostridium sp. 19966]
MISTLKDARTVSRIKTKIFLNIIHGKKVIKGFTVDLSCWGLRFKTNNSLDVGDLVSLSFIFKSCYFLNAKIVEKVSENEYRALFIFHDLQPKYSLDHHIEFEKQYL